MKFEFTVPGQTMGKPRARSVALKRCRGCNKQTTRHVCPNCGTNGILEFMTTIMSAPKDGVLYENLVSMCARDAMDGMERFTGAIRFHARAYMEIPKSRVKKIKEGQPHCQKPDWDNIGKILSDACSGVVWTDDCLLFSASVEKYWTHQTPRVDVVIEQVTAEQAEINLNASPFAIAK